MTLSPNSSCDISCPPAVILAGGFGTRLQAVYPDIPKPMIPVLGRPFLHHLVDYLFLLGVPEIFISTGYKGNQIAEYFAHTEVCARISCIREPIALGTGGAIAFAFSQIKQGNRFLVMNGDSLASLNLNAMLEHMQPDVDAVLAAVSVPEGSRFGTLSTTADRYLNNFCEKTDSPEGSLINAGMYLLRRSLFPPGAECRSSSLEKEWFPSWIALGKRIAVIESPGPFLDIGTPESLNAASSFLQQASFLIL